MALAKTLMIATSKLISRPVLPCSILNITVRNYEKLEKRVIDVAPFYQSPDINLSDHPLPHHVPFGEYNTEIEKLRKAMWPWNKGIRSRLPEFFKKHYMQKFCIKAAPVHYIPNKEKYRIDSNGIRTKIPDIPIPIIFPKESDEGLWGGEGIVMGSRKRQNKMMKPKTIRVWKPQLVRRVFYSEILDQYLAITVTLRLLDLVDEAYGFDNYILQTKMNDLHSKLGMRLKRAMLKTLNEKSMYPDDEEKQEFIYNKYQKYIIPPEQIEWLGLTLPEAEIKQKFLEEAQERESIIPLKLKLAQNLLSDIHVDALEKVEKAATEKPKGLFSKLNPFKDD